MLSHYSKFVGDDIKEIVAEAGEEVLLSCPVNTPGEVFITFFSAWVLNFDLNETFTFTEKSLNLWVECIWANRFCYNPKFTQIFLSSLECGDFHSLKWYRDTSRVYVYSPAAQFSNAEGSLMDRWCKCTLTFVWPFYFLIMESYVAVIVINIVKLVDVVIVFHH